MSSISGRKGIARSSNGTYKASLEVAGWSHGQKMEKAVQEFTLT
jgi:hypothetical protein